MCRNQCSSTDLSRAIDAVVTQSDAANKLATEFRRDGVTAIVLGSGLGPLAEKISDPVAIAFDQIPGFASSTAHGHRGELFLGHLAGRPVIAMAGRLHRYEGWTDDQVTFPIRLMHGLGATKLITSNAAGGVNPMLRVGDVIVIRDHINWLHRRPSSVIPIHDRQHSAIISVDRSAGLYDPLLAAEALSAARAGGFTAREGSYLATLGPNYETRAEYRMMRTIGVDVVGMSTVPEVLVAASLNLKILALSIVSNVADPDRAIVADHAEVLEAGNAAAGKLEHIVRRVLNTSDSPSPRPDATRP